jgi:peroxiredoxin
MRSDIQPGATFPDYELPDHENVTRKLSELQGDDPLILTLARGHYCPKEHQQHLELAACYPKIAVAYTQIATLRSQEPDILNRGVALLQPSYAANARSPLTRPRTG